VLINNASVKSTILCALLTAFPLLAVSGCAPLDPVTRPNPPPPIIEEDLPTEPDYRNEPAPTDDVEREPPKTPDSSARTEERTRRGPAAKYKWNPRQDSDRYWERKNTDSDQPANPED
jgi:hypothetical protein